MNSPEHTKSRRSETNNTFSTFLRISGDTEALAAILGEIAIFCPSDQRLTGGIEVYKTERRS